MRGHTLGFGFVEDGGGQFAEFYDKTSEIRGAAIQCITALGVEVLAVIRHRKNSP